MNKKHSVQLVNPSKERLATAPKWQQHRMQTSNITPTTLEEETLLKRSKSYKARISGMKRPREINTGNEVNIEIYVCNQYDHEIDVKVDLLTFWNNSSITNYATVPKPAQGELFGTATIPFTFTMPDEPAAFCPTLFRKVDENWIFAPPYLIPYYINLTSSTTPIGYEPVIWDYFCELRYTFAHEVGIFDERIPIIEASIVNLGNQPCKQKMRVYSRWLDEWDSTFPFEIIPWGTTKQPITVKLAEMPEEDAIFDLYIDHQDPETGDWITTETTTVTIKPVFEPGAIHIKRIDTEKELISGTKPNYLKLFAAVSPVNKVHLFAKDTLFDKPVSNILTVEGAVEGDIEINVDPNTFFTKNMPNREWHLTLYSITDKR